MEMSINQFLIHVTQNECHIKQQWILKDQKMTIHYLVRNHEATEEVPEHIERSSDNGSHIMVGCDSSSHHPKEGEV